LIGEGPDPDSKWGLVFDGAVNAYGKGIGAVNVPFGFSHSVQLTVIAAFSWLLAKNFMFKKFEITWINWRVPCLRPGIIGARHDELVEEIDLSEVGTGGGVRYKHKRKGAVRL